MSAEPEWILTATRNALTLVGLLEVLEYVDFRIRRFVKRVYPGQRRR